MTDTLEINNAVRVRLGPPETHCRTPHYLRGKVGVIEQLAGEFGDPSKLAFYRPGLPRLRLYRVRFRQADLWPEYSSSNDTLVADIYETWLEPIGGSLTEAKGELADA